MHEHDEYAQFRSALEIIKICKFEDRQAQAEAVNGVEEKEAKENEERKPAPAAAAAPCGPGTSVAMNPG